MDDASADVALSASNLMIHRVLMMVEQGAADAAAAADLCDRASGVCLQIIKTRNAHDFR